ncbi:MAG: hydrogenase expression/formation protein HypE [bacterium]
METTCPIPISDYPTVTLAHGGGGTLMRRLITQMFMQAFDNDLLNQQHDGAVFQVNGAKQLAFTTDSYVVQPLFFPGGDIGALAVNGTINDLAMCGARPLYLSAGFILEEGLPMETLWRVVRSMKTATEAASVRIVTGDTKVVDRGNGDGIFINTAGVGSVAPGLEVSPRRVQQGDAVILSGDIGRHGIAIMAVREGLAFESEIESDCAPLSAPVQDLLKGGIDVHCLRDLTRGGFSSALVEIAESSRLEIRIEETAVPVREDVRGACEMLGLDPMYVANEGRFVAFVPAAQADKAVGIMKQHPACANAVVAGHVIDETPGLVTLKGRIGALRILDMLSGEQLPRIC